MRIDAVATDLSPPRTPKDGAKLRETALEFEALLIGQMLASARADSQGWFGTGEDSSGNSLIEFAQDQIAKAIAQGGGLGLAKLVEASLGQAAASSTAQISGKLR